MLISGSQSELKRMQFAAEVDGKKIPNHTDSCPKACRQSPVGYNPYGRLIYFYCSQAESQSDLPTYDIYGYSVYWADRYRDEDLEPIVRLYAAAVGPTFVLMNDNACPHRADIVDDYLEIEEIACMAGPAYSPELNLIENIWDALGRAVP
ncbi:transposable element Tcb1 transposase [Trichonephila clavipes]|nr:transposable element Tcb1 transposase [Trichonephila clavipes]